MLFKAFQGFSKCLKFKGVLMASGLGAQVDIFAAGVLLYFMLRGRLPFSGESHSAVLELLDSKLAIALNYYMFYFVLHCFTLFYFVLACFSLFYFVLLYFTLFYFVLACFSLFYFVLHCFTLFYFVLASFSLFYFVLHCFTVFYFVLASFSLFYFAFTLICSIHSYNISVYKRAAPRVSLPFGIPSGN